MEGKPNPIMPVVSTSAPKGYYSMIVPGLMAVLVPLFVGIILGKEALGGLLAGAIVTGLMLAIMMANAGGAWDNAKNISKVVSWVARELRLIRQQ